MVNEVFLSVLSTIITLIERGKVRMKSSNHLSCVASNRFHFFDNYSDEHSRPNFRILNKPRCHSNQFRKK